MLTVGHGFFVKLLATILGAIGAIGAAGAGFVGGLVIALVTYFRRRRMRRAAAFGR